MHKELGQHDWFPPLAIRKNEQRDHQWLAA
jgi:hypothetical protein